jgi:hypothetical protein
VEGGVDDSARAGGPHLGYGGASPPGGLGDGHDPFSCGFDQGGNGGDERHGNCDEK